MVFYFTPRGYGPGKEDWLLYMASAAARPPPARLPARPPPAGCLPGCGQTQDHSRALQTLVHPTRSAGEGQV